jgi:hypothetical protein
VWVAALVAGGAWYFTWASAPRAVNPGGGPTWDPLLYVLDLVVLFLSLGQRLAWDPTHGAKAVALGLTVAGWILATAVVDGVTRLPNRAGAGSHRLGYQLQVPLPESLYCSAVASKLGPGRTGL